MSREKELMTKEAPKEKIKVSSADIIVEKINGKPYYSIKYFDLSKNQGYIGFGSYNLEFVFEWKEKYFEIVDRVDKSKNDNMDLISRKALMEGRVENDPVRISAMCAPTAYDVDAVCDEIQKKSDKASDNIMKDKGNEQYWYGREDGLDEALEIVRNGGKK